MRKSALAVLLATPIAAQTSRPFQDPAPPKLHPRPGSKLTAAKTYKGHRFVAAPKPLAKDAVTEDWPGFLGPRRDAMCRETQLLKKWPKGGPKLVWSMTRGEGYASPAVKGDRLVFPHRIGARMHIDCLQATTGKRFWRVSYPSDYKGRYIRDSGARSTPQIDGQRVYVHGVEGVLHCLDLMTGHIYWKRDLKAEFKLKHMFFGVVGSPLIDGNRLFINLGAPGGPSVVALDKLTGKVLWGSGTKWGMSCASPIIAEVRGRLRLFVLTGGDSRPPTGGLMVLDPSNGQLDFEYPFRSRTYESVTSCSPLVVDNRVFLTASYNTGTVALDLDAKGGFKKAWFNKRFGIEFSQPIFWNGAIYAIKGAHGRAGAVVCLNPKTGKELNRTDLSWEETVVYNGRECEVSLSIGAGSVIRADGAFLCLGDLGHLLWLDCSPTGTKVLARASLFAATESWTPPVISRGLLYACQNKPERFGKDRQGRRLLCYDLRKPTQ